MHTLLMEGPSKLDFDEIYALVKEHLEKEGAHRMDRIVEHLSVTACAYVILMVIGMLEFRQEVNQRDIRYFMPKWLTAKFIEQGLVLGQRLGFLKYDLSQHYAEHVWVLGERKLTERKQA